MDSQRRVWLGVLAESLRLLWQWVAFWAAPLVGWVSARAGSLSRSAAPLAGDAGTRARAGRDRLAAALEARRLRRARAREGGGGAPASPGAARAALAALGRRALSWKLALPVLVVLAGAGGALYSNCGLDGCPDVRTLSAYQPGGAPVLLDRSGERFADLAPFERVVVSIDSLPEHVPAAFIAVEDRRFWKHDGVDWKRVVGAALTNVKARGVSQGSSTISMQLARNVFPEELPGSQRTFKRKIEEMRVAKSLEAHFEKREILEMYMNHIYFGGGAYGIEAAAQLYFGKPAASLTLAEAATLAALPKAPTHYDPRRQPERSAARRGLVLGLMEAQGLVTPEEASKAREAKLAVREDGARDRTGVPLGAYFIDVVRPMLEERFGEALYRSRLRIYTTLDPVAQRAAEKELEGQLESISGRVRSGEGELQGAVVVLEAATGEVMALVGGRDPTTSRYNRATLGRRQLGSSFKPFVFAAALEEGVPTSRVLLDLPLQVQVSRNDVWQPSNYDGRFEGSVSLRQALVRSRNIPTIRLASEVGIGDVARAARAAGVEERMDETPALALGTVAVSPLQLASAYTTFATLGRTAKPIFVLRVEDEQGRVLWEAERPPVTEGMDPRVAYIVTDILQDAVDYGTGTGVRSAGYRGPAAGKTGTTNDATDVWFVGYTPDLVGAVWVGYDRPSPLGGSATGGGFAAPIWGRVMRQIYQTRPVPRAWSEPQGIARRTIDTSTGYVLQDGCRPRGGTVTTEIFLAEYVPSSVCPSRDFWTDLWSRVRGEREPPRAAPLFEGPYYPAPVRPQAAPPAQQPRGRGRGRDG